MAVIARQKPAVKPLAKYLAPCFTRGHVWFYTISGPIPTVGIGPVSFGGLPFPLRFNELPFSQRPDLDQRNRVPWQTEGGFHFAVANVTVADWFQKLQLTRSSQPG